MEYIPPEVVDRLANLAVENGWTVNDLQLLFDIYSVQVWTIPGIITQAIQDGDDPAWIELSVKVPPREEK